MSGIVNSTGARSGVIGTTVGTPAGGMLGAERWLMTSEFSGDQDPITNWAIDTTAGYGRISAGGIMTQSSGIFTFPATGIWHVAGHPNYFGANMDSRFDQFNIHWSSDSLSSWSYAATSYSHQKAQTLNVHHSSDTHCLLDVTNTSTQNVKFDISHANTQVDNYGHATNPHFFAVFLKLGDT